MGQIPVPVYIIIMSTLGSGGGGGYGLSQWDFHRHVGNDHQIVAEKFGSDTLNARVVKSAVLLVVKGVVDS